MTMTPGELLRRIRYLLLRDRYTAELEEEMRLHRELRAARLEGGGLDPSAARYAARRRFGNATHHQERSRDMWGLQWMENAAADLRFAVRRLRSRPAFAISTILVTALGIGATTAVFSAVDAAILRPLPFHEPHELVTLTSVDIPMDLSEFTRRGGGEDGGVLRSVDVRDVSAMRDVVASVAGFAPGGLNLEDPEAPRRVKVGVVTANFFSTLGVAPAVGRGFTAEEGRPRGPRVAVLSNALWRSQYGGGDVIGRRISLHGNSYEVIGVMPPRFSFPSESDLWIPLSIPSTSETFAPFRGWLPSQVIARLAPGVEVEDASARLVAEWQRRLAPVTTNRPDAEERVSGIRAKGAAVPLQQNLVGSRRKAFLILLGATALLLLIASANVANLLLSDGAARRREFAVREVIGAGRGRIVRQLLVESVVLALGGAIVGVLIAPVALGLLRNLLPEALVGTAPIRLDPRALTFATVIALATGTIFGLWPALGTSRVDPGEAIKSGGGQGATSGRLGATRRALITAEVALTVMLLVGAGLMLKSFHRLMSQDFGMDTENVGTLEISFARGGVRTPAGGETARRAEVVRQVLGKLRSDPRIAAVGVVNDLPLRGGGGIGLTIEPIGVPEPKEMTFSRYLIADGGFFAAMRIPVLQGRVFQAGDDSVGQRVAVINRSMANTYWPDMNPLGRTFYFAGDSSIPYQVVGVVADVRENKLDSDPGNQMYFSADERSLGNLAIVARSTLPRAQLLARMAAAVREAAPTQAVFNLRMMEDVVSKSVAPRRTNTLLIAIFGGLALVLSAFGVYAVVSYSVTQRSREFGIRSALGAARRDIFALVGHDMMTLVAAGLVIGLAGAWALSRVLASMLYEVDVHDFVIYAAVPLILLVPAGLATLVPTLRATRVSPTEVMRAE
ncbi:MAG TPA: ABC transporter permease [Gemmatimonadaceae bacterium]|nr:ABC transporter permease [Gemmatimonadaceae bacterium]